MRQNKIVPVLITCDIDPTPEIILEDKRKALELVFSLFEKYGIKATFFWVANVAADYCAQIRNLVEHGHEIGCHGLTHALDEEYDRMPESEQREYLSEATQKLEDVTGNRIRSFRGPMVKTSHVTQKILEELNYKADSSVCSQRLDLVSSNLINTGWIFAPRLPYRPGNKSAYKKGERNLLVVPVSAMILPFISSALYTLGTFVMKRFFNMLYLESKLTGKPIVYLLHPVEYAKYKKTGEKTKLRGLNFRRRIKLHIDEQKRFEYSRILFEYISSFQDVRFMTLSSYVTKNYEEK